MTRGVPAPLERDGWLSAADVRARLGLSKPTLNRRLQAAARAGGARVRRDGRGRWWLHPDDLDRLARGAPLPALAGQARAHEAALREHAARIEALERLVERLLFEAHARDDERA